MTSQASRIFTRAGVEGLGKALNASEPYRSAAARWEGSIVLQESGDGEADRAVFLDLRHGECAGARLASESDLAQADFILAAPIGVWQRLLDGETEPVWAVMSGKLRLARGSLARIAAFPAAARELVAAARAVGAEPPPSEPAVAARAFQTTGPTGLRRELLPMRLWSRAKRLGVWDPDEIDFEQDRRDWRGLAEDERDLLLRLTSLFQAGEESVALELLPLIQTVAEEGRLEEEIYLTSFLWEEAKHVDLFRRFLDEVAEDRSDLSRYHTPSYRRIFYEELPAALGRLRTDRSPEAQAAASVTYNLVVEGVLAETGYHTYYRVLQRQGLMPGMLRAVGLLKSDEARHLAYGVFLLSRLVAEHGDPVWHAIERRMGELLTPAIEIINEAFACYDPVPFGLEIDEFTDFAFVHFRKRIARIETARGRRLEEVLLGSDEAGTEESRNLEGGAP